METRYLLAQLAKCARCKSRLITFQKKNGMTYYACPKMLKKKCEGCYLKEEEFIRQFVEMLKKRRIEIVLEEK